MNDWQLIETAPKDGNLIMVYDGGYFVAAWYEWDGKPSFWVSDGYEVPLGTHWMPLPDPPSPNEPTA